MANIGYVRVSTAEQNTGRQFADFEEKGIHLDKVFEEHISGKDRQRPQLAAMIDYVREGDTVYIESYSRLARNTRDLLNLVHELEEKGVTVVSLKENFDTFTPQGRLMITFMQGIAQFERDMIKERQAEGIAIAKEQGKYAGRKEKQKDNIVWQQHYERYMRREINKVQLAKEMNVSRPTLDKWLKEVC
jgi:DNA invertase Pin-like site-specific DNA recombinase